MRLRGILAAAGLLIAGAAAYAYWLGGAPEQGLNLAAATGVPVSVAVVEQRDVPHRVSSIGTVQSLHTVVIRPQVTGILSAVLFREGDLVERGAPLARIDDRSIVAALALAEAEKASRAAQLRAAEVDLKRFADIADRNVIPRQQVDQQAALVERLKAEVLASEAAIVAQQVQLSHTRISSPVSGRVGIRRVDPGNLVEASSAEGLVTVTQTDPISVMFTLPQESLAGLLAQPDEARISTVTLFDRDAGTQLAQGRVSTFDNQIDPATGTLRLRAVFANPDGRLWPGQFVAVSLETGFSDDVMVFPARALQQGLNGPFVYRVRDEKVEVVPLVIAYQEDDIVAVAAGLEAGERVVTDGQSRLKAGTPVRVPEPAGETSVAGT